MRIEWATVCLNAEVDAEGNPNLLGVLVDITWMEPLGEPLDLLVALVLAESYANLNPNGRTLYALRWVVRGPDLNPIAGGEAEIPIVIKPDYPKGWDGRTIVLLPVTFRPVVEGAYEIEINLEDEPPTILTHVVRLPDASGEHP